MNKKSAFLRIKSTIKYGKQDGQRQYFCNNDKRNSIELSVNDAISLC